MKHIVEQIATKDYLEAQSSIKEQLYIIAESKINEVKKMMACSEQFMKTANQKKVAMDVLEQQTDADDEKQARMNVAMHRLKGMMKEEQESGEESSMARSELAAIIKDAKGIMSMLKGDKELEAWVQSKITKSADYMSSVLDSMEGDKLDEAARIKIVKARIRDGQIQRRKKLSNVPGYTLRGGKMTRMTAAERRRRKLGAKRAKIKKRGKMTRILMKRRRSLQKRQRLGL